MTHTQFRKVLTTVSSLSLPPEKQKDINAMLTHSDAVASSHYTLGMSSAIRHHNARVMMEEVRDKLFPSNLPPNPPVASSSKSVVPSELVRISPVPSSSSSNSSESSSIPEDAQLLNAFGKMTEDSHVPVMKELDQKARELGLSFSGNRTHLKRLGSKLSYRRNMARSEYIMEQLKRLHSREEDYIKQRIQAVCTTRGWSLNTDITNKCLAALSKAEPSRPAPFPKGSVATVDREVLRQIETQNWPLIRVMASGDGKGKGIFAVKDIPRGIIVADYHGELLSNEEGRHRYQDVYQHNENNRYMFYFQFLGKAYWVDAVKECPCHSKMPKGRFFNHGRGKNANIKVKQARDHKDHIHLLMYTAVDIKQGTELVFDYGVHRDGQSDQEPWM